MEQSGVFEDCEEENGLTLQPELLMLALESFPAHHVGV